MGDLGIGKCIQMYFMYRWNRYWIGNSGIGKLGTTANIWKVAITEGLISYHIDNLGIGK